MTQPHSFGYELWKLEIGHIKTTKGSICKEIQLISTFFLSTTGFVDIPSQKYRS
jgi:hypothetical protein